MDIITISLLILFVGMLALQIYLQNKLERMQRLNKRVDSLIIVHLVSVIHRYQNKLAQVGRSSHSLKTKKDIQEFFRSMIDAEDEFDEKIAEVYEPTNNPFKTTSKLS